MSWAWLCFQEWSTALSRPPQTLKLFSNQTVKPVRLSSVFKDGFWASQVHLCITETNPAQYLRLRMSYKGDNWPPPKLTDTQDAPQVGTPPSLINWQRSSAAGGGHFNTAGPKSPNVPMIHLHATVTVFWKVSASRGLMRRDAFTENRVLHPKGLLLWPPSDPTASSWSSRLPKRLQTVCSRNHFAFPPLTSEKQNRKKTETAACLCQTVPVEGRTASRFEILVFRDTCVIFVIYCVRWCAQMSV